MITQKPFDVTAQGEQVTEYTLTNESGASVTIIDFGGIVTGIKVPDRDGKLDDVALGYDNVATYQGPKCGSMGMLIGRVGNRIAKATFDLEGKTYPLGANNGVNNLHGGPVGFGLRMWEAEPAEIDGDPALIMRIVSEDGDQGFPGKVEVQVTYLFTRDNELVIHYEAVTDQTTLVNLTNHAYFNLDGHDAGNVNDLVLQINAENTNEVYPDLIPTGKLLPVSEVPFNFSEPKRMGDILALTDEVEIMKAAGGVDFNYCAGRDRETKLIATLYSPRTGRVMDVITDQPGVQCYTGQGLDVTGKGGVHYGKYAGLCLETQHYPDAIHHPEFPTIVLRPQDTYDTCTIYRFGVK
ncbi:MAG: galactose mutarotase [bacterium]|nr:galactose mutarotase [bacterium]